MSEKAGYLVDVGMGDLPFPIRALSRVQPEGQPTVANISISARISREFEARGIDTFIRILHRHRERIGTDVLRANVLDYRHELHAATVTVHLEYPFFVEKLTPVSSEKSLVRYLCTYSVLSPSLDTVPKVLFKIAIPVLTSYPNIPRLRPGGLFAQLSIVVIETQSEKEIYPEYLVELVEKYALAPVYSFLTDEDQSELISRVHSGEISSVQMVNQIEHELTANIDIQWFSVRCSNYGMLHTYSTVIGTERTMRPPYEDLGP
jgi:GTP cyclohydrolase I